jgi:transcriptional regulator GlxA family with amidase domain
MFQERLPSLRHFAFMPLLNFTMIAFTNAIEVLRMSNQLSSDNFYK